MTFYFHDIHYNSDNFKNHRFNHFGDLVVFDDPITLDNNLHSPPIGRA
ncbi:hypothetical protein CsSME_00045093 [Camellia sinensis var. sinensis]